MGSLECCFPSFSEGFDNVGVNFGDSRPGDSLPADLPPESAGRPYDKKVIFKIRDMKPKRQNFFCHVSPPVLDHSCSTIGMTILHKQCAFMATRESLSTLLQGAVWKFAHFSAALSRWQAM
jgi:hypothetical protein